MTTFSTNYQIKLIGDGEEASTWGASTNKNLQLIEQMAGGGSIVDVTNPPGASDWNEPTLEWITTDSSSAGSPNSEGRSRFVTFTDASIPQSSTVTVEIRGDEAADFPERVFFVKNGLATQDLTLDGGGGVDYTVANGAYAVVYCSGGAGGSVESVLNDLQVGGLNFKVAAATIQLKDDTASALDITEGTNSYIDADTSAKGVVIGGGGSDCDTLDIDTPTVDLSTQVTELKLKNNEPLALKITQGSNNAIVMDTDNEKIIIGDSAGFTTLGLDVGTIDSTAQAVTWELNNSVVDALTIKDSAAASGKQNFIKIDTLSTGADEELRIGDHDLDVYWDTGKTYLRDSGSSDDIFFVLPDGKTGALNITGSGLTGAEYFTVNTTSDRIEFTLPVTGKSDSTTTADLEVQNGLNVSGGTLTSADVAITGGAISGATISSTELDTDALGSNTPGTIVGTTITGNTSVSSPFISSTVTTVVATITGINQDTEALVTAANTFTDGQTILIEDVNGMVEVNDNYYVVSDRDAASFKLKDSYGAYVDSSVFTAYVAPNDGTATESTSYVNLDSTTGSGGFGFRSNSGSVEIKNSGGSWSDLSEQISSSTFVPLTSLFYFDNPGVDVPTWTDIEYPWPYPDGSNWFKIKFFYYGETGSATGTPNRDYVKIYSGAPGPGSSGQTELAGTSLQAASTLWTWDAPEIFIKPSVGDTVNIWVEETSGIGDSDIRPLTSPSGGGGSYLRITSMGT